MTSVAIVFFAITSVISVWMFVSTWRMLFNLARRFVILRKAYEATEKRQREAGVHAVVAVCREMGKLHDVRHAAMNKLGIEPALYCPACKDELTKDCN